MAVANRLGRVERGETYSGYTDLTVLACPVCGILYAIPETLRAEAHRLGHHKVEWSCPNGHSIGYPGKSEAEEERELRRRAEEREARAIARRDQAEADARAQKGRATRFKNDRDRIKRRVAAGVCPCCNRTFQNLARHMESKHPEFTNNKGDE